MAFNYPLHKPARVYVATDDNGWHKVGFSVDPDFRVKHLTRDRRAPVRIVFRTEPTKDAERVENAAHWLLADHESYREWFRVTEQQAIDAVAAGADQIARGELPHVRFAYEQRKVLRRDLDRRMRAVLGYNETRQRFIDEAVIAECARREAVAEKLAREKKG